MASTGFTDLTTGSVVFYNTMEDEHEIVVIDDKVALIGKIGNVVVGDINSQEIEFEINRFYDNVDLLDKDFYILFKTKGGLFKVPAIDISYNDEKIRFNWLMGEDSTMYAGGVQACVQIEGKDELGNDYIFKTAIFSINIKESLREYDAPGVYRSWAVEIEKRITALETALAGVTPFFIGTQLQYKQALANGWIVDGMTITITDI